MSLLVWLPLNGNLDNKGTSDVSIIYNTAYYTDNGKIGKALSADGSTYVLFNVEALTGLKKFSISCWKKTLSTSDHVNYGGVFRVGLYTKTKQSLGGYERNAQIWMQRYTNTSVNTEADIYWTYDKDVSGSPSTQYMGCGFNNGEEWTHCTVTCDGEYFRYYKNGVLLNTSYKISDYLDDYYLVGNQNCYLCHNNSQNYLNDFRIYDHCLSASEVKEISKGLVLHYPFNDSYIEGTTNLMNYRSEDFTDWSSYGFGSLGIKTIETSITPAISGQVCRVTSNGDASSVQPIEMACWSEELCTISNGESVSCSAYVKGVGSTIGKSGFLHVYNSNGTDTQSETVAEFTFTDEWQRVGGKFTWTKSNPSADFYSVYVVGRILKNESFLFCNVQLENKDHVTPYTSISRSAEAVIADCGGYGNDGSISGSIISSLDTPRYNISSIVGAQKYILGEFNKLDTKTMTCVFWAKKLFTANYFAVCSLLYNGSVNQWWYLSGNNGGYSECRTDDSPGYAAYSLSGNYDGWNQYCVVRNNGKDRFYVNGVFKLEVNRAVTSINQIKIGNNVSGNFDNCVSDVRIYTTALSDNDILELYNTSAKINKNGTLMCYEIKEN